MIVVTGATGNVGRSLVGQLLAQGASVRALTRDPERAGLPADAETVRADLTDAGSMEPLLQGADGLFLSLAAGGSEAALAVVDAAVEAGVRRIVLNSSIAVTDTPQDEESNIARWHAGVERAIRASGLEWTFVRGGMYAANTLDWFAGIRESGVVRGAHPDAVTAPVHEADLAAVAAAALLDTSGTHLGKAYPVTGPQALTFAEMTAEIGLAIGRGTRFVRVSEDEAAEAMAAQGVPKEVALQIVQGLGTTIGTRPPLSTVEPVLGRPGRTFAQWAREHVADFR